MTGEDFLAATASSAVRADAPIADQRVDVLVSIWQVARHLNTLTPSRCPMAFTPTDHGQEAPTGM